MSLAVEVIYPEELYLIPTKPLVILHQPWSQVSSDDRVLLQKILTAIGRSVESIQIVHQPQLNLSEFKQKADRVLYFGPEVKGLAQHELITLEGTQIIICLALSQLQSDAPSKAKLWQALKMMFKP